MLVENDELGLFPNPELVITGSPFSVGVATPPVKFRRPSESWNVVRGSVVTAALVLSTCTMLTVMDVELGRFSTPAC